MAPGQYGPTPGEGWEGERQRAEWARQRAESQRAIQQPVMPPKAPDRFGAIAYSLSDGTIGASWNFEDQSAAETAALKHCHGRDPSVFAWGHDVYLALAYGDRVLGGYGRDLRAAEYMALTRVGHIRREARIIAVIHSKFGMELPSNS